MEAIGFKRRLEEAKKNKEIIKLIFQYPSSDRAIIRNGYVININEDSFDFEDRFDGIMTFSYDYLCEISKSYEKGGTSKKFI